MLRLVHSTLRAALLLSAAVLARAPGVAAMPAVPVASAGVDVPVVARLIEKGQLLSGSDFSYESRPVASARSVLPVKALVGLETTRRLMPGAIVQPSDVMAPQLVRRGEPVTIAFRDGPLVITSSGRALSSGGAGDLVRVVSTATNRTFTGTVDQSGQVRIQ